MSLGKNPRYRRTLNKRQLEILLVLFEFRFVSVPLVSQYLNKDKSTIYERLLVLEMQDYVYKSYDRSFRLPGRAATYCLAPAGIRALKAAYPELSQAVLRHMNQNKLADRASIDKSLYLFQLYLDLQRCYPHQFENLTRSYMATYKEFIRPLPDLYLEHKQIDKPAYILEIVEARTFSYLLRRRLNTHSDYAIDYAEDWGDGYPTLLFICGNEHTERRLQRMIWNTVGLDIYTTTQERLMSGHKQVWLYEFYEDDDEPPVYREL